MTEEIKSYSPPKYDEDGVELIINDNMEIIFGELYIWPEWAKESKS